MIWIQDEESCLRFGIIRYQHGLICGIGVLVQTVKKGYLSINHASEGTDWNRLTAVGSFVDGETPTTNTNLDRKRRTTAV